MMYERDDLIYFAGLFDGEGTVGWQKTGRGNEVRFEMAVVMTDKHVIEWIAEKFGGEFYVNKPPSSVKRKQTYKWRRTNTKAIEFYQQLRPFLKIKSFVMNDL